MAEFGALSLVPPLLAIGLAIATRKAVSSLFLGVWAGGVIFTGGLGLRQTFEWLAASVGDSTFHARVVIFTQNRGGSPRLQPWEESDLRQCRRRAR